MNAIQIIVIIAAAWVAVSIAATVVAVLFFKGRKRAWEAERQALIQQKDTVR